MHARLLLALGLSAAACGGPAPQGFLETNSDGGAAPSGSGGAGGAGGATGGAGGSAGDAAAPAPVDGLPCDVQQILQTYCTSCHSDPPGAAPMGLGTYADLTAKDALDPTKTVAQESLVRMQSTASPMPPSPASAVSAAELATFSTWVSAGTPTGTCGASAGGADGGASGGGGGGGGGADAGVTAAVCTSTTYWTKGNSGSSRMHPGEACIACHSGGEGPGYAIAGTVYPSAHEPNDCNGDTAATVVITDANGQTYSFTTNSAGNFYDNGQAIALPYQAKVVVGGNERAMATPQTSGDCNSCHTATGASGAPGRIMAP